MELGAGDGDDGLAAFARATAPRTERLRQRYGQESQPASSDDEHDDYGKPNHTLLSFHPHHLSFISSGLLSSVHLRTFLLFCGTV